MASRNVLVTATLNDSGGVGVSGKTISFSWQPSGTTTVTQAGTSTTNASGQATNTISFTVPGTYDIFATFAGDAADDASSGSDLAFLVKTKTTISVTALAQ